MEAGSYDAKVRIGSEGLVETAASVPPLDFPFAVTGVSPANGGENGGYDITISGSGFPLNAEDASISLCGKTITPHTSNNIETTFTAPECPSGIQTLTYSHNG